MILFFMFMSLSALYSKSVQRVSKSCQEACLQQVLMAL